MLVTAIATAAALQQSDVRGAVAVSRRAALASLTSYAAFASTQALAFDNGTPEMALYKMATKRPGEQPSLGITDGKLRTCDYAPNCFSTSGDSSHLLSQWQPKAGSDAMAELVATIKVYPPGQADIDKGGFSIVRTEPNYLYVQYESLKNGFIDVRFNGLDLRTRKLNAMPSRPCFLLFSLSSHCTSPQRRHCCSKQDAAGSRRVIAGRRVCGRW